MFEFLDRLITIALPRVRDFRGVSGKSFDGRGNYNMGVVSKLFSRKLNTIRLMPQQNGLTVKKTVRKSSPLSIIV